MRHFLGKRALRQANANLKAYRAAAKAAKQEGDQKARRIATEWATFWREVNKGDVD